MTQNKMKLEIQESKLDYSNFGLILTKKLLAETITQFEVYSPLIATKARAGQFVMLRVTELGERIPLTIVDRDPQAGAITLIIQAVGKTTRLLCELEPGEKILDILGPLGTPSEIENYGRALIVAGGVGAAVAFPVAKALKEADNHVTAIVGARSKDLIILKDEFEAISDEVYFTTDDGSFGFHGFTSMQLQQLLDHGARFDYALAVGPVPMMRSIADITKPYQIPTKVSLNPIMVDGTGMCGGCRVQVGDRVRFTCVEGPEFDGHLVDFDTLQIRNSTYNHLETCRLEPKLVARSMMKRQAC